MIFVTVGNGEFEELIKIIDYLVEQGKIKEEVVVQIGLGKYKPKRCKWFTFEPSLEKYYKKADLVISHGGPGTVFEILRLGKKLIAVPNCTRTDPRHQVEFLQSLAKETTALIYCEKFSQLENCLAKAKTNNFERYRPPECNIAQEVLKFMRDKFNGRDN